MQTATTKIWIIVHERVLLLELREFKNTLQIVIIFVLLCPGQCNRLLQLCLFCTHMHCVWVDGWVTMGMGVGGGSSGMDVDRGVGGATHVASVGETNIDERAHGTRPLGGCALCATRCAVCGRRGVVAAHVRMTGRVRQRGTTMTTTVLSPSCCC